VYPLIISGTDVLVDRRSDLYLYGIQ